MQQPQLIFDRLLKTEKERKDINAMMKDALENSPAYQQAKEEVVKAREKFNKIKEGIFDDFRSEKDKLETLKAEKSNNEMLLSDAALSKYLKGEDTEITDSHGNKYEMTIKIKYKKVV